MKIIPIKNYIPITPDRRPKWVQTIKPETRLYGGLKLNGTIIRQGTVNKG